MMKVLAKSVLSSTVTQKSIAGCFRAPGITDVVFAKQSSLELLTPTDDGRLHSVWQQTICGSIIELKTFPWNAPLRGGDCPEDLHGKDLLALVSDSGNLTFVTFDTSLHRFVAVSQVPVPCEGFSGAHEAHYLAIERNGWAVAVASFRNRLAIFPAGLRQEPMPETASFYGPGAEVVDRRASLYFGKDTLGDSGSGSRQPHSGMQSDWGTIWSIEFLDMPASQVTGPSILRLAAAVHREGSLCSEIHVLQWERGRSVHCIARLTMPHEEQLGVLQQVLPVPHSHACMVAVGTKAVMVLDWATLDGCGVSSRSSSRAGQAGLGGQPDVQASSCRGPGLSQADTQPSGSGRTVPVVQLPSVFAPEPSPSVPFAPRMVELFVLPFGLRDTSFDGSVEHTSRVLPHQMQVDGNELPDAWDGMHGADEEPQFHLTPPAGAPDSPPVKLPIITGTSWFIEPLAGVLSNHRTVALLLAMDSGDLHTLTVRSRNAPNSPQELEVSLSASQYKAASPVRAVTALPSGGVVMHCEVGDTEVLQLQTPMIDVTDSAGEDQKYTQVWSQESVGPILDFVLADLCMEGQPQLYTACAQPGSGSVRIVRASRGVDLLHKTSPSYCGLSNMWSVAAFASDRSQSLIVLSFVGGTRVLQSGWVLKDVTDIIGVEANEPTVAVGRLVDGVIAQVTRRSVRLYNLGSEGQEELGDLEGVLRGSAFPRSSSGSHSRSQSYGSSPATEAAAMEHATTPSKSPLASGCSDAGPTVASASGGPSPSSHSAGESDRGVRGVDDVWLPAEGCPISLAAVSQAHVVVFSASDRRLLLLGLLQSDQDGGGMSPEPSHAAHRCRKRRKRYCLEAMSSLNIEHEVSCLSILLLCEAQKLGHAEQLVLCGTYGCTVEVLAITCHPPCSPLPLQAPQLLHVSSFSLDLPRQSGFLHHFGPLGEPATRDPSSSSTSTTSNVNSVPGSCHVSYGGSGPLQVLIGLRNGMLVQLESLPTTYANSGSSMSASQVGHGCERTAWALCSDGLQMVLHRRLGSSPITLIPTDEASSPTLLALGERPWLVSLAPCSRRMEQVPLAMPSTAHAATVPLPGSREQWPVTDVTSFLCYCEDGSLLLAAVECEERVNCTVWNMDASPRRLMLHPPSNTLIALVSKQLPQAAPPPPAFEVRCLAPQEGGRSLAFLPLEPGEAGTCLCVWHQTALSPSWTQHGSLHVDGLSTWTLSGFEAPSSEGALRLRKLPSPASCSGTALGGGDMRSFSQPPPRSIEQNMEGNGLKSWLGHLFHGAQEQTDAPSTHHSCKDAMYVVVGTSRQWPVPTMEVASRDGHTEPGRASRCKGRILVLRLDQSEDGDGDEWNFHVVSELKFAAQVLALAVHPTGNLVASVGSHLVAYGMNWHGSLKRVARIACGMPVVALSVCPDTGAIASGDRENSIVTYSLVETPRPDATDGGSPDNGGESFEFQVLYADGRCAAIADCQILPLFGGSGIQGAAAVTWDGQLFIVGQCDQYKQGPEHNLARIASFHVGTVATKLARGSLTCRSSPSGLPDEGPQDEHSLSEPLMAGTLLGGVMVFNELGDMHYLLLQAVEAAIARHPLTGPLLGHDHREYRRPPRVDAAGHQGIQHDPDVCNSEALTVSSDYGSRAVESAILDGDLLQQLLELPEHLQREILADIQLDPDTANTSFQGKPPLRVRDIIAPQLVLDLLGHVLASLQ